MTEDMLSDIESLFKDYGVPARGRGRRYPRDHVMQKKQQFEQIR
jgi:hypothetical protein